MIVGSAVISVLRLLLIRHTPLHHLHVHTTLLANRFTTIGDAIVFHAKVVLLEELLRVRADLDERTRRNLRLRNSRQRNDGRDLPPVLSELLQSLQEQGVLLR